MKKEINWSRYNALEEFKQDILSWLFFDDVEAKFASEVCKKIDKYQKYMLRGEK